MADALPEHAELDHFTAELRKLHERAGRPSLRAMARSAHYSHTALSGVLSAGRLPSLPLTLAFVRACRGNEDEWRRRWNGVHGSIGEATIPVAIPRQDVEISVTFTAPSLPGSCRVDWKMTDQNGRLFLSDGGGLYMIVNITG
jgi:hypothetical protein